MPQSMLYQLDQTFEYNLAFGPFWDQKLPVRKLPTKKYKFLNFSVNSLFGVSACPLTVNSRFLLLMAKLGYDLLTYKSVRSVEWHGNVFPHWMHVDLKKPLLDPISDQIVKARFDPFEAQDPSMANSFGIQSIKPEYWQADVDLTLSQLPTGQLLILSLMCTPQPGETLIKDATRLAKLANETSAKVFEINLACPNTDGGQGLIYEDIEYSLKLCKAMKKVLGNKHLLVKVGYYKDQNQMREFLRRSKGIISGISSTNTYSMKVLNSQGKEAFPTRPLAGISGAAIRNLSQQQAQNAVRFKQELELKHFAIIGIGGVTRTQDVTQYLDLGVDAVQTAVGALANPYLAQDFARKGK